MLGLSLCVRWGRGQCSSRTSVLLTFLPICTSGAGRGKMSVESWPERLHVLLRLPAPLPIAQLLSCAWLFFKYFECRNTPRLLSLLELDFHTPATLPFFPASQSRVFCLPTTWFNSREGPFLCCILSTDISGCLGKGSRDLGGAAKEVQNTLMSHSCKVRGFQRGARARCGGTREAW